MIKIKFAIIFLCSISYLYNQAQSVEFGKNSLGFIIENDSVVVGTGFVSIDSATVITCAHVIRKAKISFTPVGKNELFELSLVKIDREKDIAVLKAKKSISNKPIPIDTGYKIPLGESFFYIGFNKEDSKISNGLILKAELGFVKSIGITLEGSASVTYIEFVGNAIPGYSGGPVVNKHGNVIGLISQSWERVNYYKKNVDRINRAISIKPVFE